VCPLLSINLNGKKVDDLMGVEQRKRTWFGALQQEKESLFPRFKRDLLSFLGNEN